jgi:hypothetical protein
MVRTFLKVYMELSSYFLFLQEQIKDIIILAQAVVKEAAARGSPRGLVANAEAGSTCRPPCDRSLLG